MKTIVATSLMLMLACAHAREAEDPSRAQVASEEQHSDGSKSQDAKGEGEAKTADPERPAQQKEGRVAGGGEDPNEIPVASSPSGLLKPGAEDKVRDRLGVGAGDGSLRQALQKYQKEHDLPATGIVDQRTVEALGLDPDDVFERAHGQ